MANDRAGIEAAGTWAPRALGHFLFSKKKEKHPWAVGHSGKCSFPKNSHGHSGTRALRHSSKNYQKTIKKTIQRLSKRLSVTIYIPKMIVSSVRSSNSHPDLLLTHPTTNPLFQITPVLNTGLSLSEPLQLYKGYNAI